MNRQLENLKAELLPLEQQRIKLDEMTRRRTNLLLWSGLGGKTSLCIYRSSYFPLTLIIFIAMSLQFGFFAQLTWGEYSWDIMEPVTYFTTCATLIGIYVYFALIRQVQYVYYYTNYWQNAVLLDNSQKAILQPVQRCSPKPKEYMYPT